jgi:hypothetical protein
VLFILVFLGNPPFQEMELANALHYYILEEHYVFIFRVEVCRLMNRPAIFHGLFNNADSIETA